MKHLKKFFEQMEEAQSQMSQAQAIMICKLVLM
jgi:hypothetical protein